MQNNNLLKKAILALLLCMATPCVNAQIAHIGDILCTTGVYVSPAEYEASGLEAMGVIFYVDETGQHGWAIALEDEGSFKWTDGSIDTPLPNYSTVRAAIYDIDGMFNTQEILNWNNPNGYTFYAFEAVDVANGWYLPAIGQLNYLYGNLVEVNDGLSATGGTVFDMTSSWNYWSSTEMDSMNRCLLKSSGNIGRNSSSFVCRVRGVRSF